MRIGQSGKTDKLILLTGDGFYLSIRVYKLRLRVAFGGRFKRTFTWIWSSPDVNE